MKNKKIKKLAMVAALVAVCGLTTACGSTNAEDAQKQAMQQTEETQEATPSSEAEATQEATPSSEAEASQAVTPSSEAEVTQEATPSTEAEATQEVTPSSEAEATQEAESTETADSADLTGKWEDLQFILEGKAYQLPVSYQALQEAGWSFNLADYGLENGYVMNPGDKVHATIDLTNPAYDEKLKLRIGFKNNSDSVKDITECDVWSVQYDTCYAFKQLENFADMTIGNGLTLGSTKDEVLAACGPCDDIYESKDNGYAVYSYDIDFTYYLKVTVYDDLGVTAFTLSTYE